MKDEQREIHPRSQDFSLSLDRMHFPQKSLGMTLVYDKKQSVYSIGVLLC